jgi:BirA family transcriptional regulator, biotin operon repressor / biotin---[acetyl-CoA-carboxylase] ligase
LPIYDPSMSVQLLAYLKANAYITGSALAQKLGISVNEVSKRIHCLKRYGYVIESTHTKGYRLACKTDLPVPWELAKSLQTSFVGKQIIYKEIVGSTQSLAKSLAETNQISHGAVIIAQEQKRGKGRLKRRWISPKGGLWLSIILQPLVPPARITLLPLVAALAACDSIRETTELDAKLKWPNDVLINGKKVAGILLDASLNADDVSYVIIGIGINANVEASAISSQLKGNLQFITSIKDELGHDIHRLVLTRLLLEKLEKYYLELEYDAAVILRKWKQRSDMLGRQVKVMEGKRIISGTAIDINDDGSLLVKTDKGKINIATGDVQVRYPGSSNLH